MSKDDSSGGFLSKVVKFVRHPTTSWSELDARGADKEHEYSKAALKEMIERKRRNDFVRKREFDMLRKIRSREGVVDAAQMRPSFFQSSLPSKPDDRAMTLKKIDEIEAQMSMQWWKTKAPDSYTTVSSQGPATQAAGADRTAGPLPRSSESQTQRRQAQYNETEAVPLLSGTLPLPMSRSERTPANPPAHRPTKRPPEPVPRAPVAHSAAEAPQAARRPVPPVAAAVRVPEHVTARSTGLMAPTKRGDSAISSLSDFSASRFFAMDVHEIAQDPNVEEAAIRFANGDEKGAEQGLLDALSASPADPRMDDWLALFDFYRATGQLAPFESQAIDFANRFGRSAPQWHDMPAQVASSTGKAYTPSSTSGRAVWVAEAEVDAYAVGALQNILLRSPAPWVLDWSALKGMDLKAARALLGMFTLWGDQDVELCFIGSNVLREQLKSLTPSGRRDVEQLWWELRMAALRVMNRPDEFELTALDFCVTFEVSPPGWEKPHCHFRALSVGGSESPVSMLGDVILEPVPASSFLGDSGLDVQASDFGQLGLVELSGEICGDAQPVIESLEKRTQGADVLIISCHNLIRVDFAASGALLNWVSRQHADGRMVQFVGVQRLVSAFFHVVGITEYAKVVVSND